MVQIELLSSLAKVYPDQDLDLRDRQDTGCMLRNEVFSFQAAFRVDHAWQSTVRIELEAPEELRPCLALQAIDFVPCDFPMYEATLKQCEHPAPGLFPDILRELPPIHWVYKNSWRSVFIRIDAAKHTLRPGSYELTVKITSDAVYTKTFRLDVLDAMLPPQKLRMTNWFHTDCLCNYYGAAFDSEEYWRITENFAKTAAEYGVNMLLTPVFTPPLDTAPGGERRTIQLVDVRKDGDRYTFGFEKLSRWISMCRRAGIKYLEISHLFTQWGCKYAPKVMGLENGEYKRIFGWETDGHGIEYLGFLEQFLPALIAELKAHGVFDSCYFHVSDEPSGEMMEDYKKCAEFMRRYIAPERLFDALSDIAFYKNGLITCPVVAIDHIHPFIDEKPEHLWGYYCCGQITSSNRFLAYPSGRNRMLGAMLFKYNIEGFLQWGFNFYNSHLSLETVDPYATSTAGGWVPGGDPYVVYPGKDGNALPSLRLEVFREALQDLRALEALTEKMQKSSANPREAVVIALGLEELRFDKFNADHTYLIRLREKINRMLAGENYDGL